MKYCFERHWTSAGSDCGVGSYCGKSKLEGNCGCSADGDDVRCERGERLEGI